MHRSKLIRYVVPTVVCLGIIGCGEETSPQIPAETSDTPSEQARTLPVPTVGAEPTTTGQGPLRWDISSAWVEVAPSSTMRLAQYRVPGSGGDGECVVFYFGPGQGGDPMANAQRWAGQFSQPDGSDSLERMKVQELDGGSLDLVLVEVIGTYEGGMSTGVAPAEPELGWMLLGGIAQGPDAPWFFKFTGPRATLEENRDAFVDLLRSIRQEI